MFRVRQYNKLIAKVNEIDQIKLKFRPFRWFAGSILLGSGTVYYLKDKFIIDTIENKDVQYSTNELSKKIVYEILNDKKATDELEKVIIDIINRKDVMEAVRDLFHELYQDEYSKKITGDFFTDISKETVKKVVNDKEVQQETKKSIWNMLISLFK